VTSDLDIWRSAQTLLKAHGEEKALLLAAQRVDSLLESGDREGRRTWLRIL